MIAAPAESGDPATDGGTRRFHVEIRFTVIEAAKFLFALAPAATSGVIRTEAISAVDASGSILPNEIAAPHGGRLHLVHAGVGAFAATYDGVLDPSGPEQTPDSDPFDMFLYGRPSRYCPSDHLGGFAVAEFGTGGSATARIAKIVEWIGSRVGYLAGSSDVHDSAEDTLLTGVGTCRDFAHLGIALCRAVDIPARFVSVYAPGLSPMDFHAVFEVFDEGRWWLQDPTHHAPRQSMTRIATGRDAADTAFATVAEGLTNLDALEVTATVDGILPYENHLEPFELP